VLQDDDCGWFDGDTQYEVTVAFARTASGPESYVDEAAEWPWLGYMSIEPSWSDGLPEPSENTSLVYLGQDSEDALSPTFDAAEIYLSSISFEVAENGSDYVDNYARFGISH